MKMRYIDYFYFRMYSFLGNRKHDKDIQEYNSLIYCTLWFVGHIISMFIYLTKELILTEKGLLIAIALFITFTFLVTIYIYFIKGKRYEKIIETYSNPENEAVVKKYNIYFNIQRLILIAELVLFFYGLIELIKKNPNFQ